MEGGTAVEQYLRTLAPQLKWLKMKLRRFPTSWHYLHNGMTVTLRSVGL